MATGKLSENELVIFSYNIIASGINTIRRFVFTTEQLAVSNQTLIDISVDATRSKKGDQLSIFFVTPFPGTNSMKVTFTSNNVFLTQCGPILSNTYTIYFKNSRFLLNFVYNGESFINCQDDL
jgi:hypothetical protein